ncbi:MAG: tyrosine-type recombinase/integrase [Nitrososphaerales archaeon]
MVGLPGFEPGTFRLSAETAIVIDKNVLDRFYDFCLTDLQLTERTAKLHRWVIQRWLSWQGKRAITIDALREYLKEHKRSGTYACIINAFRAFFRDFLKRGGLVESFKLPRREYSPKIIPNLKDLQRFYEALPTINSKAAFLLYATTGLRRSEVLSLTFDDIDFKNRMVRPKSHKGSKTKHVWVTFYNEEAEEVLKKITNRRRKTLIGISDTTLKRAWKKAQDKTGLHITPQDLREWFSQTMGEKGVPDRYVDAFQGRIPRSVIARNYTDYSPERLKRIYDQANLRVLN